MGHVSSGEFRKGIAELIYAGLGVDYFMHRDLQTRNFFSCCPPLFLSVQSIHHTCQIFSVSVCISSSKLLNGSLLS